MDQRGAATCVRPLRKFNGDLVQVRIEACEFNQQEVCDENENKD
jgi:hypothetical protein